MATPPDEFEEPAAEQPPAPEQPPETPSAEPPAPNPEPPQGAFIPPPVMPGAGGYERETSGVYGGPPQTGLGTSNYPRYYYSLDGAIPPGPPTVRFSAISEGWELIRKDLGVFVAATLLYAVIGYTWNVIASLPAQLFLMPMVQRQTSSRDPFAPFAIFANPQYWAVTLGAALISNIGFFILGAGFFSICIKRLRGQPVQIGALFDGFKSPVSLAAASVASLLLTWLGFIALVVPLMFFVGVSAFVPQLIVDQKVGAIEAFRMSYFALKRDWLAMWALCFVAAFFAEIGFLACGVGALFTTPIYFMTLAIHYHAYFPPQGAPEMPHYPAGIPQYSV